MTPGYSPSPRPIRSAPRAGFTLIEILASLTILAIGLAAVVALVLGSSRLSTSAVDRNIASIIISEAVEDIERNHRITSQLISAPAYSVAFAGNENDIGCYVETYDSGGDGPSSGEPWPNIETGDYVVLNAQGGSLSPFRYPIPSTTGPTAGRQTMMVWPPSSAPKVYGGPMRISSNRPISDPKGIPYRVIYRLERHPDWVASVPPVPTPYEDIYVLTLVVYKDMNVSLSVANPAHRYEQITDPVVTFMRRKR